MADADAELTRAIAQIATGIGRLEDRLEHLERSLVTREDIQLLTERSELLRSEVETLRRSGLGKQLAATEEGLKGQVRVLEAVAEDVNKVLAPHRKAGGTMDLNTAVDRLTAQVRRNTVILASAATVIALAAIALLTAG